MVTLEKLLNLDSYCNFIEKRLLRRRLRLQPNLKGAVIYPPGHFYSPLLDIQRLKPSDRGASFDGEEWWENIDLRRREQQSYYEDLLNRFFLCFPSQKSDDHRYFTNNSWFKLADAFTLSAILRKEKPRRIIEVGSGFSSAVMLDTLQHQSATFTFIEPFPDRLDSLLLSKDKSCSTILIKPVQEVSLSVFAQLAEQDVLFIDSSHVAKIGSDVTFLLLRILPRLNRGVLIHFHDIFYPFSYPANWIKEGRAWNESLFLRAFLVRNPSFEIVAFNSFAGYSFPELFRERLPAFLDDTGGSLWLRKVA